ncbi:ABC transporter ATP-binding protein [Bacteriovorax stolpii]|uniref:ABC transporter ATP-binding protein n=1 Tax=Bacteriovorax stolpii TaxID=960 RepID=A0A2K9NWW0_BACTC|nr:ABC transporter ATP-binding protein [Bacteriovorax stolpii]AUN99244.1 ABC transporter ATP-binding protein [Bacteriovorax stolpii]QDK40775.1 ABC transporter ATP-binding protein [Bacteriovorax stolpii]TDP55216.1 branched-chain amino acid transport system ATP-binding protein [Bacteriovorax stolpii]
MLKVDNVGVSYGGIKAVRGVSIELKPGELVSLIGSNGSGKTSLLRAISGLVDIDQGSISIDGKDLSGISAHDRVKMGLAHCPEARKIFGQQSVMDNLLLGAFLRFKKEKKSEINQTIEEVFNIFPKLRDRQNQQAGTMSGGEQQMLAIGRALMLKPKILILDEPSMGLAPVIIDEVFNVVGRIKETRTTSILLVEQLAYRALQLADRAYVLEQGVVRIEGTGKELQDSPEVKSAYLGGH